MVVGAVIRHWVIPVAGEEAGMEIFRRVIQWMAEIIYTDDVLLAPPIPPWIQAALDILTGIFDRVGLHTNLDKTVGMV